MIMFTSVQTMAVPAIGDYPTREKSLYNSNETYSQFKEVMLEEDNSIYTSLVGNNQGNYPATSSDYWTFKEKLSVYRPIQIIPTSRIVKVGGFSFGMGCANAEYVLVTGAFGNTLKLEELDSVSTVLASETKTIDSDID